MANDILAGRTPEEVAAFYGRLADLVDKNKGAVGESLSALLLRTWLGNRDPEFVFEFVTPLHLKANEELNKTLEYHRSVYLTEEKARIGKSVKWAGIVPRIQRKEWDGATALHMEYECLVEIPIRKQVWGSDADKDILYALHGFQLRTTVDVFAVSRSAPRAWKIHFSSAMAQVVDRYDWDYSEHLTVPNPDYGSSAKGAVDPGSKTVKVHHSNAKRVEDAGLAAPYDIRSKPWWVMLREGTVDPQKNLG